MLKRVEKMGDLFEPVLGLQQRLPKLEGLEEPAGSGGSGPRDCGEADGAKRKPPAQRKSKRRTKV